METQEVGNILKKIISGGQTGADQAALDFAIEKGIPHGGWIPKGRRTENGPLPAKYNLRELESYHYPARTEKNVLASQGTLIVSYGPLTGGSALTARLAHRYGRPCLHLDLTAINAFAAGAKLFSWLKANKIEVLNVAGPRLSTEPRIYEGVKRVLESFYEFLSTTNEERN